MACDSEGFVFWVSVCADLANRSIYGVTQHGITASTGSVGDSYDNALAENVNGSCKDELVHTRRWDDGVEAEIATFEWVSWWNETKLHQSLRYRTPVEVEAEFGSRNHHRQ